MIKQIYYLLLRVLRFLRETTNPLADCADGAEKGKYNKRRRCLTMHNRGQAHRAQPAESVLPEICASKWHNIVRHLRRRMIVRYPLPAGCAIAPPAVMHGLPSPMAHPRGGRRANYDTPLQVGKAGLLSQIILKIELICVSQSPIRRFCESISITLSLIHI